MCVKDPGCLFPVFQIRKLIDDLRRVHLLPSLQLPEEHQSHRMVKGVQKIIW